MIDAFAEQNIAQHIGGASEQNTESIRDTVIRNSVVIGRAAVDGDDDAPAATRARCVLVVVAAAAAVIIRMMIAISVIIIFQ